MPNVDLGSEILEVQQWISLAGQALARFYDGDEGIFYRNSRKFLDSTKKKSKFPTSTNRSFYALLEYLRFLREEDWGGIAGISHIQNIEEILKGVSEKYFSLNIQKMRRSNVNNYNIFTDSHLFLSVACLKTLCKHKKDIAVDIKKLRRSVGKIAGETLDNLTKGGFGGKLTQDQEIHDFITLHAIRGIDAFDSELLDHKAKPDVYKLQERVKETVLKLLAYDFSGISSKFDPVELAFSISLLNRLGTSDVVQLTNRAVKSIVDAQAKDGAWPATRLISYEAPDNVHIASYEIALSLTDLLIRKLSEGDTAFFNLVYPAIRKSFELVKSHYTVLENSSGWVNDHTRKKDIVESWATAVVLSFLLHFHDALQFMLQQSVLSKYRLAADPSYQLVSAKNPWPDMIPALRDMAIDDKILAEMSDPSEQGKIRSGIKQQILEPIQQSWINRPDGSSVILYGPPGTRKTSMAISIGRAIGWPVIIFSPPDFLRQGGLEGFEASADEIFQDLSRLRRVVVLFDECEEFFKSRIENSTPSNRTSGAFITSGMLPRLQMLRDTRWILFILGTNSKLEDLDEAVRRKGRFDFVEEIGYPTLHAQISYVQRKLGQDQLLDAITKSLRNYAETENLGPGMPPISFSIIDELLKEIKKIRQQERHINHERISTILREKLSHPGPKHLID